MRSGLNDIFPYYLKQVGCRMVAEQVRHLYLGVKRKKAKGLGSAGAVHSSSACLPFILSMNQNYGPTQRNHRRSLLSDGFESSRVFVKSF